MDETGVRETGVSVEEIWEESLENRGVGGNKDLFVNKIEIV